MPSLCCQGDCQADVLALLGTKQMKGPSVWSPVLVLGIQCLAYHSMCCDGLDSAA